MRSFCVFLLISALGAAPALATVRNVPADYPSIQIALNASTAGDIVLVAPGDYVETLMMGPAQDGVALLSQAGPLATSVNGNFTGPSVLQVDNVGPGTRIEGFTFWRGGAPSPATATLGGGILLHETGAHIENNIIHFNLAHSGGGIFVDGGAPTIVNNLVMANDAIHGSGGGIYCDHFAAPHIEGNVIAFNHCVAYGGGLTIWEGSSPRIVSNTITYNEGVLGGGGIFVTRNSHPNVARNIVATNPQGGGVRMDDFESTVEWTCNDVTGNAGYDYSGLPDPTGTNGNISAPPLFCYEGNGDFHLQSDSPCAPGATPPGCDLIGALGVACNAPVATTSSTWGRLKAAYR